MCNNPRANTIYRIFLIFLIMRSWLNIILCSNTIFDRWLGEGPSQTMKSNNSATPKIQSALLAHLALYTTNQSCTNNKDKLQSLA